MNRPALDLATLHRRTLGNLTLRDDLLRLFRDHGQAAMAAAAAGLTSRDSPAVTAAAHRLKGSAATIGATDLADIAGRVEAAAGAGEWDTVTVDVGAAASEMARCVREIDTLLRS